MSKSQGTLSIRAGSGGNIIGSINANGSSTVKVSQQVIHQATPQMEKAFRRAHRKIKTRPEDPKVDKAKLEGQVKKIEAEAAKGKAADPTKLERWMKTLGKMAPDIVEVMAASLGGPVAGFTVAFKKIVERARAESNGA